MEGEIKDRCKFEKECTKKSTTIFKNSRITYQYTNDPGISRTAHGVSEINVRNKWGQAGFMNKNRDTS